MTRLFCCALCQAKGGTGEQQKEQHFKHSSALMESKEWVDKGAETSLFHLNFGSTPGRKLNLRTHSLDTFSKAQSLLLHFSIFYNSLLHFFPLSYNFFPFLLQPHHWQHCSHRDTCAAISPGAAASEPTHDCDELPKPSALSEDDSTVWDLTENPQKAALGY